MDANYDEYRQRALDALQPIRERMAQDDSYLQRDRLGEELWQTVCCEQFLAPLVSRDYGGTGGGMFAVAAALEAVGSSGIFHFLPVLTSVAAVAVELAGSEQQKTGFLANVAQGEASSCLAVTEKESGFNLFRMQTSAARDGDDYVISGEKLYISGVNVASHMLLVARTTSLDEVKATGLTKTYGISLFLIDPRTKGITFEPVPARGEASLLPHRVTFDNVRVPSSALVGEENQGTPIMLAAFNPERILFSAIAVGMSDYCLTKGCEYARERRVFRDPIGAYQAIQHPLADAWIRQQAVRRLAQHAALAFDRREDPMTVSVQANAAKVMASELAQRSIDAALDCYGGKGFDERNNLVQLIELARFMRTSPISNALILNAISEYVLGLPRSY